jgi:hypothetical protein
MIARSVARNSSLGSSPAVLQGTHPWDRLSDPGTSEPVRNKVVTVYQEIVSDQDKPL